MLKIPFLLTTCALILGVFPLLAADADEAQSVPAGGDYILMASDLLQVRIFQEDDLARDVSVSQNQTITLPLIGTVDVKGRTVRETEALIRDLYDKDFLVNPQVNLTVIRYAERTVNILGSVNSPGPVVFPQEKGLTLLEAISRAGGFSRLANKNKIKLTRTDLEGESSTYIIDATKLIDGKAANSWSLQINDVIFVPESIF
ncbi:MAG: polysaccharide biosynthesis/export family protein [Verrucomicrobiota bacterium]